MKSKALQGIFCCGKNDNTAFLGFQKGMSQYTLHRKFQACGIEGNLLKLKDLFIADIKQFVKLKDIASHRSPIHSRWPSKINPGTNIVSYTHKPFAVRFIFTSSSFAYVE